MKTITTLLSEIDLRDDDNYEGFLSDIRNNFNQLVGEGNTPLFTTNVNNLYEIFLSGLPEEAKQHYNCRCCRRFVDRFGGIVTITEAGILALKSYMIKDDATLTLDGAYGNIKYVANIGDTYEYGGNTRFECMVTDINQREFILDYTAKAYVKYTIDGKEYVAYSEYRLEKANNDKTIQGYENNIFKLRNE